MKITIKQILFKIIKNVLPNFGVILSTSSIPEFGSITKRSDEMLKKFETTTHSKWNLEDCDVENLFNDYYLPYVQKFLRNHGNLEDIRLEYPREMYNISEKIYACFHKKKSFETYLNEHSSLDYSVSNEFYNWFNLTSESFLKHEYLGIFVFVILASLISLIIIILSYLITTKNPETEKLSTYECGFEPYEDSRHTANISFCIIAVLFIVFDIEILFLIPWSISLSTLPTLGFWSMIEFIIELGVGILYIWIVRSLDQ